MAWGTLTRMALSLRPYQEQLLEDIRASMRRGHRRILAVMPTGAGKGTTIAVMVSNAAERGHRVLILAHRAELIADLSQRIHALGINHGILANGYREDLRHRVQVGSVQTVVRRLNRIPEPTMIIQDEAHHLVAGNMWGRVIETWPRAFLIGKTATPERLSGEGLGEGHGGFFTDMVLGPDAAWLTEQGFLVPARIYAPPGLDLSGIKRFDTKKGKHDSEDRLRQGQAMGDAVSHYRRTIAEHHNGTAIAFCVSVAHAEAVAEAFRAQGIAAAMLDGATDRGLRRRLINDLGTGTLKVLTSCDIISEGTDIPSVTGAILLRPTDSLGLHLQQVGRVLRPSPGKTCLLRGSMVLTDKGLVPIERVTIDHKVWDGLEFVQHSGAICQGRKAVITHDGITATPDHLVMTLHGWRQIAQAKAF